MGREKTYGATSAISTLLDVRPFLNSLGVQYLLLVFRHPIFHMHSERALWLAYGNSNLTIHQYSQILFTMAADIDRAMLPTYAWASAECFSNWACCINSWWARSWTKRSSQAFGCGFNGTFRTSIRVAAIMTRTAKLCIPIWLLCMPRLALMWLISLAAMDYALTSSSCMNRKPCLSLSFREFIPGSPAWLRIFFSRMNIQRPFRNGEIEERSRDPERRRDHHRIIRRIAIYK